MYKSVGKRLFDLLMALSGILVLSPIFLLIAILIKIDSDGPVFFQQIRVGKDKKLFRIYKFRTMKVVAPQNTPKHLLQNPHQFITKVGLFLRKTSLDELPQLFNVVKGEMSLIGPRPALWNQTDLIQERDVYQVNRIYPGMTGWAQINGRDELSFVEKARLDGEYVVKLSMGFDMKCFFKTLPYIFKKKGVREGDTKELRDRVRIHPIGKKTVK